MSNVEFTPQLHKKRMIFRHSETKRIFHTKSVLCYFFVSLVWLLFHYWRFFILISKLILLNLPFFHSIRFRCYALCERPPKKTMFRYRYKRGDFPIALETKGILWKTDIPKLDFHFYLPMFFEGLIETTHPYKMFARQAVHDMLTYGGNKIFPCIPQLIIPIKNAFNTRNREVICVTLKVLQHLLRTSDKVSYGWEIFLKDPRRQGVLHA